MSSVDISKLDNALVIICGIVVLLVMLLVFFVVLMRKRHNLFLKEKELMQAKYEQVLLQSQLEIQEQAFNQISAEIHDNIGQLLSLVRINLNTLSDPVNTEKIRFTDDVLGKAISDLRNLSHNLNTNHLLREGVCKSIEHLVAGIAQTGLYQTAVTVNDDLSDLSDEKAVIIFRIVQEALNNIIRHAAAKTITVSIDQTEEGKAICITDDGIGIDSTKQSKGLGLKNMYSRAKMIGASVDIRSGEGKGTQVLIKL